MPPAPSSSNSTEAHSVAPSSADTPEQPRGWVVALACAAALSMSIGPLLVYSFSLFVKPLQSEFGWSRGEISLAVMLLNIMVAVASPFLGLVMDRWGSMGPILLGHFGIGLAALLLQGLSPNLWHLYLLYALAGLLGAGSAPVPYARLVARWFGARRGLALGLVMAGVGVGSFLAPPLIQGAIADTGWRAAYGRLALLAVALPVPVVLLFVREAGAVRPGLGRSGDNPKVAGGLTRAEAMRKPLYWQLVLLFFLVAICANAVVAHLSPILTDAGLPPSEAAQALSLFGSSAVLGRLLTGWLVDRFFAGHVVGVLFAGMGIGMVCLAFGSFGSFSAILVGLGLGAEVDVMPYLLSRYFGFRSFGEIYGYTFAAFTIGLAIGPALMGWGFDLTGSYRTVLLLLLLVLSSALLLSFRLPRYTHICRTDVL